MLMVVFITVCSTFLHFVRHISSLGKQFLVRGFFDGFLGGFFKGKLSSAQFPPFPLNRSSDLCTLSLACHRSCKLVPGNLSLLALAKIVYITVRAVTWQSFYVCLFIQLVKAFQWLQRVLFNWTQFCVSMIKSTTAMGMQWQCFSVTHFIFGKCWTCTVRDQLWHKGEPDC